MMSLQFFDSNKTDDKNWCCNNCERKYIIEIKELREYKLEKLKDKVVKGIFDGEFSASTPQLSLNDLERLGRPIKSLSAMLKEQHVCSRTTRSKNKIL
jgi:hypothetical protein